MADRIQIRGDTAAAWTSANPILADREIGWERDTKKIKVGDGTTAWNSLGYDGVVGPTGPQGIQGIQGATGSQGIQGIKGDTGNTGSQGIQGIQGVQGPAGSNGTNGAGVAAGGTTGQALVKTSATDYATGWSDVVTPTGTHTLTNKTIGGADNTLTADGTNAVGFRTIPQNSQSTAYTCVLTDSGKHILHPSADTTARTFTIPANSSVAYPIGTAITFVNQASAGVVTISITTDTIRLAGAGTTGSRTLAANGVATAIKLTATEWIISGTGLT